MSYKVAVTIYCDHEGCTNDFYLDRRDAGGMNFSWASWLAKRQHGWQVNGTRALCPTHRTRRR